MGTLVGWLPRLPRIVAIRLLHHRDRRLDATSRRICAAAQRRIQRIKLLGTAHESLGAHPVRAQHGGCGGHRILRHGGHRCLLPARAQARRTRTRLPARRRHRRSDRQHRAGLPHRRYAWQVHGEASAGHNGSDGRALQIGDRRSDGHPRTARRRASAHRQSHRRQQGAQLLDLRHHHRRGARPERLPQRPVADQHPAALLRIPHHGRARNHLHRCHGCRRLPALARRPLPLALAVVDHHAVHPAALYCKHRGLDDCGDRSSTVARIRTDAHRRWILQECARRQHDVHAARIHGALHGARHHVPLPGAARHRDRPGTQKHRRCENRHTRELRPKESMMETIWFCLVAIMVVAYVVLDGFDLGAGIVHLLLARNDEERRLIIRTIGPVWDGNEVWLLAGGGTLYFAFPLLYASSFSGFYLPLMIVLWLLVFRGISIEFRNHVESPVWAPLWDAVFCFSSLLLAVFYGAALGNVVRGVPLDARGYFFEALWTDFRLGPETGILDWYTILVGLAAFFALAQHGALWLLVKTAGAVEERARRVARVVWWGVAALTVLVTWFTFRVQPQVPANLSGHRWGYVFPLLALAGLLAVRWFLERQSAAQNTAQTVAKNDGKALLAYCT